jgi:ribosomal protein L3 glutamine methyltransferase
MITETQQQQARAQMHSARDALAWGEAVLRDEPVYLGHGTADFSDEALWLLLHALGLSWDADESVLDEPLSAQQADDFVALISRRVNERMPAAYLTGRTWFCGLEFHVDERVLIPRSPLAELIEQRFQPFIQPDRVRHVLDLCTGSGCIAVACAHAFPDARVSASDISAEALAVCRQNIALHGMEGRVIAQQADGLEGLAADHDIIVCNPPYVDAEDMASLPPEYHHEPGLALASGEDGLDFTRRLLRDAADHLAEQGILVVEVGNSAGAVSRAWPRVPFLWLEFEHGGDGAFLLTREQLLAHREQFGTTDQV